MKVIIPGRGAISTDTEKCSKIGADVLRQGGNAIDAAISSRICLGVLSPASSGIGGGCYILIYNQSTSEKIFIDSRETAPANATSHMFADQADKAQNGGLAIAVLAELKGLYLAYKNYGSGVLSWEKLILPGARLAEKYMVSPILAAYITSEQKHILSGEFPQLQSLFTNKDGSLKTAGDYVFQPKLAETLHQIAKKGPSYIYEEMAGTIAQEIQQSGGIVSKEDIVNYKPIIYSSKTSKQIIQERISNYLYVGVGGSSSGGPVVASILKFMSLYAEPIVSLGQLYFHRLAEIYKHCYAIRMSLGDPAFIDTDGPVSALLSTDYLLGLLNITSDTNTLPLNYYGGKYNMTYAIREDSGTSHTSVIDRWGNAVSMTSTINTYFGSKVIGATTGILYNNEMDDFSIPGSPNYFGLSPSPSNYPEPFKRPLSSMSPSFLFDKNGQLRLIGGASGGSRIITATAQVILNYLFKGMNLLDAVVAPRIHSQLLPDTLYLENNTIVTGNHIAISSSLSSYLNDLGHTIYAQPSSLAIAQFISIDPDSEIIEAVSDPRKGGKPDVQ
eukprot:gene20104-26102_t